MTAADRTLDLDEVRSHHATYTELWREAKADPRKETFALIAVCRAADDVPALLAEVERLRAAIDGLHGKVQGRMAAWSRADESPYTTGQVDALDWVLQRIDEIKEQL